MPGLGDQLFPWPEPQWDAERRAAPTLSLPRERRVGPRARKARVNTTRLSAFRFPFVAVWVGTGKNPGIAKGEGVRKHGEMKNSRANKNRAARPGALARNPHPEVRAQRASKDAGPQIGLANLGILNAEMGPIRFGCASASSFEGRFAAASG